MAGTTRRYDTPPPQRRVPLDAFAAPFARFVRFEASSGILLLAAAVAAIVWVNSPGAGSYEAAWNNATVTVGLNQWSLTKPVVVWINDLLMALFFLLVGLEIKRELLRGELRSARRAALPIAGAIGGMAVPAALYAAINAGRPSIDGWGVPMATDIAFALGIMALLGTRAPLGLRVFLASLAIVDDLGALVVIALFYTERIDLQALGGAGVVLAVLAALGPLGVRRLLPYLALGLLLWLLVLKSGVHATIAGVALAATIPITSRIRAPDFIAFLRKATSDIEARGVSEAPADLSEAQRSVALAIEGATQRVESPLRRLEHALLPFVSFVIVPLFALANAGVAVRPDDLVAAGSSPIGIGIVVGLLAGKPLGVFGFSWLAVRLGVASLPEGVRWRHVLGAAFLSGIGFTMALFIGALAFSDPTDLARVKVAILGASLLAGAAGLGILATTRPPKGG
ncbi:MAG: Na+/H+ antiporter NhaA [Phycisphaeraceae bacterium]|nr:Na+/H+ antiporter NhaA [Phycisphaeraceae bacterium]